MKWVAWVALKFFHSTVWVRACCTPGGFLVDRLILTILKIRSCDQEAAGYVVGAGFSRIVPGFLKGNKS
jgi:hypothetical protein